jgi:hypothetical protein
VAIVFAIVLLTATLHWGSDKPVADDFDTDRVDCPGHDFHMRRRATGRTKFAGIHSSIAEFHDCARFILDDSAYHSLYALFAALPDSGAPVGPDSVEAMSLSPSHTIALAAGEVVTPDGDYAPLGVKPHYNCLYLTRGSPSDVPRAFMLSVDMDEGACKWAIPVERAGTTELHVRRVRFASFTDAEYPMAARWQRDAVSGRYVMGVKCGAAWCEVGGPRSGNVLMATPGVDPGDAAAVKLASRRLVPGWSDEQELAEKIPGATGPGIHVRPSGRMGRVTPVVNLGDLTVDSFGDWTVVGTVWISPAKKIWWPWWPYVDTYTHKLGLEAGTNRLYLRLKDAATDTWESKVVTESGHETVFDAVRRDHSGLHVPGTLRWRWLSDDETIWARCDDGCCQVQQHSI